MLKIKKEKENSASQQLVVGERKSSCPWNLGNTTGEGHCTAAGVCRGSAQKRRDINTERSFTYRRQGRHARGAAKIG